MITAAIVLIIITFITCGVIIVAGPYIKRVTNCWYFWIIIGILLFVYVCIGRFWDDWSNLNHYFKNHYSNDDIVISKGLLLDICPFTCFILLIGIIFDPTRKFAQVISPFALFGGLITICGLSSNDDPQLNAHWILLGDTPNEMYFMMHYIMVVIGTLILVSTPRFKTYFFFKKKIVWQKLNITHWVFCLSYAIFYYSYVAICMTIFNVTQNVSGLNIYDWSYGEYSGVSQILNISPQGAAALGFIASIICISLFIFAFGALQEIKRYHWINQWNKKSWYCWKTYLI